MHLRVRGRITIVAGYSVSGVPFRGSTGSERTGRMSRQPLWVFDIQFPGGHRSRVTPVPIPNTEVKPVTADGTARVSAWESRSLPGVSQPRQVRLGGVLFVRQRPT